MALRRMKIAVWARRLGSSVSRAVKPLGSSVSRAVRPLGSSMTRAVKPLGTRVTRAVKPLEGTVTRAVKPLGRRVSRAVEPLGATVTRVVKPGPEQRALKRRELRKREIIRFMRGAGVHSADVALTSRASIALALQLPVTELQTLLDELVEERRIYRASPPIPRDHYSLTRLHPDWRESQ